MKSIFRALVSAMVLAVVSGSAAAIDIDKETQVKGSPGDVWAKVGGWCAIADWHPVIASCEEVTEGDQVRRVLTLTDGATLKELRTDVTESSYSYHIEEGPLPVANYNATLSAMPSEDGTTVVWRGSFDAKGTSDQEAGDLIGGVYEAGLTSIAESMK